jgi:hypothetical protein
MPGICVRRDKARIFGPKSSPILGRHTHGAIGVLQAPDDHTPIGMAPACGWGEGGVHL